MSVVIDNYSFNHSTKQVTLLGMTKVALESILLITDVTKNTIIYQFNNPTLGGTLSGSVLTLTFDTTTGGFADSDKLSILYAGEPLPANAAQESGGNLDILQFLKKLITQNQSLGIVDAQRRQRIAVDSIATGVTLPAVTLVSTVADVQAVDTFLGWDHRQIGIQMRNVFANAIRTRISG